MAGHDFIEEAAQNNALVSVHPCTKLLVGLGSIILVLFSPHYLPPILIALTLSWAILFLARVEPAFYLQLLSVPLGFAVMSVLVIILISGGEGTIFTYPLTSWLVLSVTHESISKGLLVFSHIFGGMCALFFISLTTPMTEVFGLMKQARIPELFVDLSMLIYRFIFIFMERATTIYRAQMMRHGYRTAKKAINSLGMLVGSLFITAWDDADDLIRAMDLRCYTGKHPKLRQSRQITPLSLMAALTYLTLMTLIIFHLAETGRPI